MGNFSHNAAFSPDVPAAVAQEVDFEGRYQRFLQNEEEEERECASMTTGEEENKKEEEADFCLMSDKPQEAMSAVPTTENTPEPAEAKDDQNQDSSSSEDEQEDDKVEDNKEEDNKEEDDKEEDNKEHMDSSSSEDEQDNKEDYNSDKEEHNSNQEADIVTGEDKLDDAGFGKEVQSEILMSALDTTNVKSDEGNLLGVEISPAAGFMGGNIESRSLLDDDKRDEGQENDKSDGEEEEEKLPEQNFAPGPHFGGTEHPNLLEGSATEAKTAAFESDKIGDSLQMKEDRSDNEDEKEEEMEMNKGCWRWI